MVTLFISILSKCSFSYATATDAQSVVIVKFVVGHYFLSSIEVSQTDNSMMEVKDQ